MAHNVGDLIRFNYPAPHREGTRAHDPNPEVLVLHPSSPRKNNPWSGRTDPGPFTHAITLKRLNPNQRMLLKMLASPAEQLKNYAKLQKNNPTLAGQFDIAMATNIDMIRGPEDFYERVIKPMLGLISTPETPYRLYHPHKMRGVRVIRRLAMESAPPAGKLIAGGADTPDDTSVLTRPTVFEKFRNKFQHHRGPKFDLRLPVFERFRNKNRK